MSLMTLVRLLAALVLGWALLALGIGAMGGGRPSRPSRAPLPGGPPLQGAFPDLGLGSERCELVNLATGRLAPLHLPEEERWTIATVSPWRDSRDEVEVVGRWSNRIAGEGAFYGMGTFRLSDAAVISRVAMEVLPTGRPCWVPGQPRMILFPAGDGRLYRCRLPEGEGVAGTSLAAEDGAGQTSPVPVAWKIPIPGVGCVMITDPVWSSDSRLRRWAIVSLSQQSRHGPKAIFEPSKLWWLEMGDQGESILAAGRLTVPEGLEMDDSHPREHYPNVAVGPGGKVQLVYLTWRKGRKSVRLCSAELHFDAETGRPYLAGTRTLAEGLGAAPPLISADGTKVFGLDASGRVRAFSLAGKTD